MPELPEVEAIAAVFARHSIDQRIEWVEILRQPSRPSYFPDASPVDRIITAVFRRGKYLLVRLQSGFIICHQSMSGYWDYEDEPWTFDYVEGPRKADDHVRLKLHLSNGKILRFHDARLFGRMRMTWELPAIGYEPMLTDMLIPGSPILSQRALSSILLREKRAVKEVLMDQSLVAGIGNIYSSEALHMAGVDPSLPGREVEYLTSEILSGIQEALSRSIPKVTYDWLSVYRRDSCGTCGFPVARTVIAGRATFRCERCQWCP